MTTRIERIEFPGSRGAILAARLDVPAGEPAAYAVEVTGPLAEEQRSKLLEITEKCPVHRTLTSEIDILTRLTE